ncbi:jg13814 [Pararge aegeria aegeria]|uniref:Jg13814 protein n=1 Tax=Pararge aegeria aegeria TaxID=348720 RepID=A0A8S4S4G5_9NEOP|nr:jg13814 [Pararge aegeria aegeria]
MADGNYNPLAQYYTVTSAGPRPIRTLSVTRLLYLPTEVFYVRKDAVGKPYRTEGALCGWYADRVPQKRHGRWVLPYWAERRFHCGLLVMGPGRPPRLMRE